MKIERQVSLKPYNTFGFLESAENLIRIYSEQDVFEVIANNVHPLQILGGGSNILLTTKVRGYLLKNEIKGIEITDEDENTVLVKVGSGEVWHTFVMWALSHDLGGVENLSLIPGTVGAAPIQNIGAYGVEQKTVFHSLTAIHLDTGENVHFYNHQCKFGYRDSIFKHEAKGQYFITSVSYELTKKKHILSLGYGDIQKKLAEWMVQNPTIQNVSDAVISIRKSKLPDPKEIGNAGSFFKNPVISSILYHELQLKFTDIPSFPSLEENTVKIPAGWLIEQLGYKGYRYENVGVHQNQALVLVHFGSGKGKDVRDLSIKIKRDVFDHFGIDLQEEVNIW